MTKKKDAEEVGHRETEDYICDALNEQGFLLQQAVKHHVTTRCDEEPQHHWLVDLEEYPVTAADGEQTRIDLVLRHKGDEHLNLCLECKRHNPKWKTWVFWGTEAERVDEKKSSMRVQTLEIPHPPRKNGERLRRYRHEIAHQGIALPVFQYYLELRLEPPPRQGRRSEKKASSTEAIENACRQAVRGQTGLTECLYKMHIESSGSLRHRAVPVVVTTAELLTLEFDANDIDMATGTIEPGDVTATRVDFAAVGYHGDDTLGVQDPEGFGRQRLHVELDRRMSRTVFVVRANRLNEFLKWISLYLLPDR